MIFHFLHANYKIQDLNQPTEQNVGICLQILLDGGNQAFIVEQIMQKPYMSEIFAKISGIDILWCSLHHKLADIFTQFTMQLILSFFPKLGNVKFYTKLRVYLEKKYQLLFDIFLFQSYQFPK